ncbi:phospholipase D-like domain-containing protein [Haloglomus irregulare]|uniref:phospholipase D-like domain-containing protein n=1 Tax=Haloglomus irregulare TaxID=2234134 RepID=UPI00163D57DA|nr:phospholipase D-like domain-containing protein [Haloglomus irregulare]
MSAPRPELVVATLLALAAVVPFAPAAGGAVGPEAEFVRAVPNPVAPEDRGESVTLSAPPDSDLGRFALDDGEQRVTLPNRTVGGRVTLTTDPAAVRNRTDTAAVGTVVRTPLPALANGGEELRLLVDGVVVDSLRYRGAPKGEVYRPDTGAFRPVGATAFPVRGSQGGTARAFVLPDAPGPPVEALRSADERLLLAGYTLSSERVADALVGAAERGVRVAVLVDGAPVGGLSRREARTLDRLVTAGVTVRLVGGPRARYAFHHAKYAVTDDRAVVLTENWKPSGTGGNGSRGWGVTVRNGGTADELARTFRADFEGRGARPWAAVRADHEGYEPGDPANGSYPTRFRPRDVEVDRVRLLVAPDNAERAVIAHIDRANESVRVLQATAGGPDQPFVRALVRAARRGVAVRVLLNGAWYAREGNRAVVRALNDRAAREGLDLTAKLADPRGRYGTVHAKGLVVDGETAVLGSLNWNNHSARENREVVLALRSDGAARYFGRVFEADWRGGAWRVPAGLLVALLVALAVALWLGRRIEFEARDDGETSAPERVGW